VVSGGGSRLTIERERLRKDRLYLGGAVRSKKVRREKTARETEAVSLSAQVTFLRLFHPMISHPL
jgi:hypothetical protein